MISVVIPNYNKGSFIREALQSILDQTFNEWEAIIVDDGSTDNSIEIVNSFLAKDSRFTLIERQRQPKGAPTCRNIGLKKSKNEYIIFLDSDDLFANYSFQQRIDSIENVSTSDFYVFQSLIFDKTPTDTMKYVNVNTLMNLERRVFSLEVPWTISSVVWRKDTLSLLAGFDETFLAKQDPELIIRAFFNHTTYRIFWNSVPDFFYRVSSSTIGLNTSFDAIEKRLNATERILENIYQYQIETSQMDAKLGCGKIVLDLIEIYCSHSQFDKAKKKLKKYESCYPSIHFFLIKIYVGLSGFIGMRIPGFQTFRKLAFRRYWIPNNYGVHIFEGSLMYKETIYKGHK